MVLGRTSEIEYLQQFYQRNGSHLLVIYGQKGIGKTTLLLEFAKEQLGFYYLARPCSEKKQQTLWQKELLDEKETGQMTYLELFESSCQEKKEKEIIIIDEFQYMIKAEKSFMKDCITFIKNRNEQNKEVLIILASSSIAWIENNMISKIGPAAYSISALYKLKELSFQTIRTMFPNYTEKQCLEVYSIFGGVPGLLTLLDASVSVADNLCNTLLKPTAVLKQLGYHLVSEELRETSVYNTILETMSSGKIKLNDLYAETGFSRAKISVYLKNLMELEFVEKVFSFDTDGKENTQKGVYQICNHFVHFWFRFIFPNLGQLERMESMDFYNTYINPEFTQYYSLYFKNVCLEYILTEDKQALFPISISKTGEWRGKNGNIDILAENEEGVIVAAFCKSEWGRTTYEDYEWDLFCLEKAVIQADYLYLFSINGFDEKLELEAKMNKTIILKNFADMQA